MSFILIPAREKNDPVLSKTGILCINPAETGLAVRIARNEGGIRQFLFNSRLLQVPGTELEQPYFIAGPAVGAPMAVLTLEKLRVLGCRRLLIIGWCGSLSESLRTGDVLLPTHGVSEEGTSAHYPLEKLPESSAKLRSALFDRLQGKGFHCLQGPVWTTDAPYRESRKKVDSYGAKGILGVDMEFSALCTVAAFRKVEIAAAYIVSDEPWRPEWRPGYGSRTFKKRCALVLDELIAFCKTSG